MAIRVIVHIVDEEPFVADVEEMPTPSATCVFFKNPSALDQKKVRWTLGPVQSVMFPMSRINFMEIPIINPGVDVQGFVRDQTKTY
jgi:hypothetical protein